MAQATDALTESLLHGPEDDARERGRMWAYPFVGMVLVSLYIAYHTTILITWVTPKDGLAKEYHRVLIKKTKARDYFLATANTQSWAMFAPNPNRTNVFMRVLVEDQNGETWDMEHDIWNKNRYPYLWYDRMGKINRRIAGKKGYQKIYGAWVCREWAREHGGELPKSVNFVKRYTKIPKPERLLKSVREGHGWGYNPWKLKSRQKEEETVRCKTVVNGQLPNEQRVRMGFDELENDGFRPVKIRTWHDKLEAEERRKERQRKLEAQGAVRASGNDDDDSPGQ